jgi:Flp pilus assembly pilin Flp
MFPVARRAGLVVVRFWRDDRGQDLIEYALLTAAVGIVAVATWPVIAGTIGTTYSALDSGTQGLWDPPPPGGGP